MAGEVLKARREDLHLNIREISDKLRIRADYLSAIENDDFGKLPAPVYTVGYIRSYAAYLDLDADSVVRFYGQHLSQPKHSTIIPVAHFKRKRPKLVYFLSAVLVIAAFFLARSYLVSRPAVKPADAGKVVVTKPVPPAPTEQIIHNEAAAASPSAEHSLEIRATDKTWVSMRFQDGRKEEGVVLQPGDIKSWKFSDKVSLRVGNAGGIRLIYDGKDIGAPGLSGEVKILSFPEGGDGNG